MGSGWAYYRDGIKYIKTGDSSIRITPSGTPAADTYFITIDSTNGSLSVSTTPWSLDTQTVLVAYVDFDSANTPTYVIGEERHSMLIDRQMHKYLHETRGTQFVSGGTLTGPNVAAGSTSVTDASNAVGIAATEIADEDLFQTLPVLTRPNGATPSYFTFLRNSGNLNDWAVENLPYSDAGGNIQYDNGTSMAAATSGKYVNSYIMFTNLSGPSGNPRFAILPGQGQFDTLDAAIDENPASFNFTGLPIAEYVIAWQLTWEVSTGYSTTGKVALASAPKRIEVNATTASQVTTEDHNDLIGLQGGNATERYHLSLSQYNDYIGETEVLTIINDVSTRLDTRLDNHDTSISGLDSLTRQHTAQILDISTSKQDSLTFGSVYQIPYSNGSSDFNYDSSLSRSLGSSNITKIDGLTIDYSNTSKKITLKNDSSIFLESLKTTGALYLYTLDTSSQIQMNSGNINYVSNLHSFSSSGTAPTYYFDIRDSSNPKAYSLVVSEPGGGVKRYFAVKPDGTIYCASIGESTQTKNLYYNTATGQITYADPCTGESATWGNIDGDITDQSDLWTILNDLSTNKFDKSGGTITGNVTLTDASLILNTGNILVNGNVGISGNLVVDGSIIAIGIETLDVSTAFIYLNTGLTGTPPSWLQSGIVIERGSQDPYAIIFDEEQDTFRIGISPKDGSLFNDASTQAVATRQDNPIEGGISYWNSTLYRMDTSVHLRYAGGNLQVNNDISIGSQIFAPNLTQAGQANLVFWNSTTGELTRGDASSLGFDTSTFLSLKDTPNSYADGSAGAAVVINDAGTGLEFAPRIWREESDEVTLANENANVLFYENIELEADAGLATLVDKDVTASSAQGTEESYTFDLDGVTLAKIYGESNGAGGIQNEKFVSPRTFLAESSVYFSGIPDVSTSYVLFYNPTSDEVTYSSQSAVAGVTALSALTDVSVGGLGSAQDGSSLVWNNSLSKWTYGPGGGGGGDYWELDGSTLIPKDPTVDVKLGKIEVDEDAGAVSLVGMSVTSTPTAGTEESYSFDIDGSAIAKVWGEADGAGALQKTGFVVKTYQYMGEPNTNGSWRFFVSSSGDLVFEKRISGTWTEKGKFTE